MTKTFKKGVKSHNKASQEAFCHACGHSLGNDDYLLKLVKKGYKLYCDNSCKAEEQEA